MILHGVKLFGLKQTVKIIYVLAQIFVKLRGEELPQRSGSLYATSEIINIL